MTFNEKKATEASAFLLRLRGGRMSYMKLIKLLYLADREALKRWGFSITNDSYVSMPHGPVVSNILNLVVDEDDKPFWSQYISPPVGDYEIELLGMKQCSTDQLSRAEENLLTEIFEKYGHMTRWKLRDLTHALPEWHDPHGSSIPISIEEILKAQGISADEITEIVNEQQLVKDTEKILGSVA